MDSPKTLHFVYELSVGWALPIIQAVRQKKSLAPTFKEWPTSTLSDLAFAIETRIGTVNEAIQLVDDGIKVIDAQVRADRANVDKHIAGPYAYQVRDKRALRQVVLGAGVFITEARTLFENLSNFYGDFLLHYFGEVIGDPKKRYEALAALASDAAWVDDLRSRRHDLLHDRAPLLGATVTQDEPRKYELFLAFNWRPSANAASDIVSFTRLVAMREGLGELALKVSRALIARVDVVA